MSGPAGQVGFPTYLEDFHEEVLTGGATPALTSDVQTVVNAMLAGGNPYEGVASYNPDDELDMTQEVLTKFANTVDSINEYSSWNMMADTVLERMTEVIPGNEDIDEDVTAFQVQAQNDLARSYNRVTAAFRDVNGVVGNAMPTAIALLEVDFNNQVARYRTERMLQRSRERAIVFLQSVDSIYRILALRVQSQQALTGTQDVVTRFKIGAKMDQIKSDIGLQVDEATWDLSILQDGAGVIGAMSGIPPVSKKLTPLQSILSSAFTGASMGMMMGPQGALLGGIGGALLGGLMAG